MPAASLEASWAELATPSFGTGIPYASQTSLPSGAVKLVRPSALTRSRTSRTAPFAPLCWGASWLFNAALAILFFLRRGPSGPIPTLLQDQAVRPDRHASAISTERG